EQSETRVWRGEAQNGGRIFPGIAKGNSCAQAGCRSESRSEKSQRASQARYKRIQAILTGQRRPRAASRTFGLDFSITQLPSYPILQRGRAACTDTSTKFPYGV